MRIAVAVVVSVVSSLLITTVTATTAAAADPCSPLVNPIACENSKPGTDPNVWDINGSGDDTIQGFGTDISVNVGATIGFKVSTPASAYTIDIYRTGYYGGLGARKIATATPSVSLPQTQPACLSDPVTFLYDCGNWAQSASWSVPSTAVSGVYVARLTRTDTGGASHIIFVVRNDASTSKLFFQTSDSTWQAYNSYGGRSFYPAGGRGYKLSYNRPFNTRSSTSSGRDFYFASEFAMVRFLERNGYDTSYTTDVDSDRRGNLIQNHQAFLSVGHDEYWSGTQRANVEAARDAGVHLAFFSGNEVYWKTRFEPSIDGSSTNYRTLVCYKETWDNAKSDPSAEWTGTWRDPRFSPPSDGGRPENGLTGQAYLVNDLDEPIKVPAAEGKLRFWRNTSVATLGSGQVATLEQSTLGYESDEDILNADRPAGLIRMSETTASTLQYLQDYGTITAPGTTTHRITLYRSTSGALVFGAGTIQWSWGLDDVHDGASNTAQQDVRMQQATVNLFADMGVQAGTLQANLIATTASTDVTAPTITVTSPASGANLANGSTVTVTGTASDAGGRVGAVEVSMDGGTSWKPAAGRESWSFAGTVTGVGGSAIKVRAADDSGNLSTGTSLSVNVACPCTIFGQSATPTIVASGDSAAIEVGTRFKATTDGYITGVRFYKSAANTGTHVGSLWTAAGQRLAQVTFTGESASGWEEALFPTPVDVSADAVYVVSYMAPNGQYSGTNNYFRTASGSAPLVGIRDGDGGGNGVFKYGASGGFPTSSYQSTNYWVDAVFDTVGPPDSTPPAVLATQPVAAQADVNPATPLKLAFTETMLPATITWNVTAGAASVSGTKSYDSASRVATFTPTSTLPTGATVTATVSGGTDRAGNAMATKTWNFSTWSGPPSGGCPCSIFATGSPAIESVADPTEIELGVKFRSTQNGFVTAVRFWKGAQNFGPHQVTLWNGAGVQQATTQAYFTSGTGWQTVYLDAPVALTKNLTYVASYHTLSGGYAATGAGLTGSGVTTGPLTALGSGVDGMNGVYAYGARTFPTSSFNDTNYWVDVVFMVPPDVTPPAVTASAPGAGATSVPVGRPLTAAFTEPVQAGSVTLSLTGPAGTVAGATTLSSDGITATFTPSATLAAATGYTLNVTTARDLSGNNLAATHTAAFTTSGVAACPCTVFASDALPDVVDTADNSSLELGLRFRPDTSGWITGIRFYKGPANLGTHTGRLWTDTGALLGSVTFSGESASGWQTATLDPAVPVTAGTTYRVSYSAPVGRYSSTSGFFGTGPFVNAPLTALADSDGSNGVYAGSPGSFPTQTFGAANYWVDAVFSATAPVDTVPPTVTATLPAATATGVAQSTRVTARFSEPVQPGTVAFTLAGPGGAVAGSVGYDAATNTSEFAPTQPLAGATSYTATVSGAADPAGNPLATPRTWTFTTAAATTPTCPCSIWPGTTTPTTESVADTGAVELGVKFRSDVTGTITGVRFYKGAANTGTHTGTLWSPGGSVLATTTFTGETAGGWQSAAFNPPVAVTAGATYVVSYHAPAGGYAADLGYFLDAGADNGPLHALRAGVSGVNGVYGYGATAFPTQGTTSNYWVDVVFSTTVADTTPPAVSTWTPPAGATNVVASSTVSAVFSEDVSAPSVALSLRATVSGTVVAGTTTYNASNRTATFTPTAALASGTAYTASASATDVAGNAMAAPATSGFTTADTVAPVITAVAATGSGTTATVTWTTNEPSTSTVAYGTSAAALTSTATGTGGVTTHTVSLTGLTPNTRYHYRVTSVDPSTNSATLPLAPAAPAQYVPTVTPVAQSTVAEFGTGTNSNTYVSNTTDGEIILAPALGNEFDGSALGTGWSSTTAATGGTTTVAGGTATLDGTYVRSSGTYGSTNAVEFAGTFGTVANRLAGFGTTFSGSAMAAFSTGSGNQLLAVTRTGGGSQVSTTLSASLATGPHVFRIERALTSIVFKIDGTTVATRSILLLDSMAVGGRDGATGGGGLSLNWVRALPYASSGTRTSAVVDAAAPVAWGAISWLSTLNGGSVTVQTRTGNTAVPDGTWTGWTTRTSGATVGATSRYLQYRISLTAASGALTSPAVNSVTIAFSVP